MASQDEVDRSVKMVCVVPALESIISCAATSAHSLVMRGLERHDDGAHFSVPKVGVEREGERAREREREQERARARESEDERG